MNETEHVLEKDLEELNLILADFYQKRNYSIPNAITVCSMHLSLLLSKYSPEIAKEICDDIYECSFEK